MGYVALDLSKSSTGWAAWRPGWELPRYGHWVLGSEYTSRGGVFTKLHQNMSDLHRVVCPIEFLFVEEPISPAQLQGGTTINTLRIASGLAAHAESFAHAMGVRRIQEFNVSSWRGDFIGRVENAEAKARARRAKKAGDARASARADLKALTIERCRQLGMTPRKDDEADAIGILTYGLLISGVQPPWLATEVLRAPLEVPA
jgi:hypothetical protein